MGTFLLFKWPVMVSVLGLTRTGLILTGLQEGAQPGGGGWPHLAKQSPVFHTMWRWVPVGGGRRGRNSLTAREHAAPVLSERAGLFCGLFCHVFSLSVSLLLFPLFAVLLNCPYPDPPVFCLFISILLRTAEGEGRPRGSFVAGGSRNQNSHVCSFLIFVSRSIRTKHSLET